MATAKTLVLIGYATCSYFQRAVARTTEAAKTYPKLFFPPTVKAFETRQEYQQWVNGTRDDLPVKVNSDVRAKAHKTSPFVYIKETETFVGGHDDTVKLLESSSSL